MVVLRIKYDVSEKHLVQWLANSKHSNNGYGFNIIISKGQRLFSSKTLNLILK